MERQTSASGYSEFEILSDFKQYAVAPRKNVRFFNLLSAALTTRITTCFGKNFCHKAAARSAHFCVICILGIFVSFLLCGCGLLSPQMESTGAASAKAQKVVRTARAQMGKKYVSGGSSPHKGFDCSGLVWWSYKQHGIDVPRITSEQAKTGHAVHKKRILAGDIVVFRERQSPRGLHTGIYAGNGAFIHSPGKGKKVCMESLQPYWHGKLIAVRRVTP